MGRGVIGNPFSQTIFLMQNIALDKFGGGGDTINRYYYYIGRENKMPKGVLKFELEGRIFMKCVCRMSCLLIKYSILIISLICAFINFETISAENLNVTLLIDGENANGGPVSVPTGVSIQIEARHNCTAQDVTFTYNWNIEGITPYQTDVPTTTQTFATDMDITISVSVTTTTRNSSMNVPTASMTERTPPNSSGSASGTAKVYTLNPEYVDVDNSGNVDTLVGLSNDADDEATQEQSFSKPSTQTKMLNPETTFRHNIDGLVRADTRTLELFYKAKDHPEHRTHIGGDIFPDRADNVDGLLNVGNLNYNWDLHEKFSRITYTKPTRGRRIHVGETSAIIDVSGREELPQLIGALAKHKYESTPPMITDMSWLYNDVVEYVSLYSDADGYVIPGTQSKAWILSVLFSSPEGLLVSAASGELTCTIR